MKIGLDASRIYLPTGEGTYTREVIRHLILLFPEDHFLLIIPKLYPEFIAPNVEQLIYPQVDGIRARFRYAFQIGHISKEHKLDIFHCLTNYAAFGAPCPIVCTVHDLATLKYPELRPSRVQWFIYRFIFPKILRSACFLFAISKSTKQDLHEYYGFCDQVRVVHNGLDHSTFNTTQSLDCSALDCFNLPENYLLFVGYLSPKKNLEVILRAMAKLNRTDLKTTLVVVGKRGYGSESFFELVDHLELQNQVIETGFVSNEQLVLLYRKAGLFVFPSIYEGFGLPVAEAMACGTPVLVADVGPLPELVGDKRCLCSTHNVDEWAAGIQRAISDNSYREWTRAHGLTRAKLFSWKKTAKYLRSIYTEAIEKTRIK